MKRAISYQPSVISHQWSVIGGQLLVSFKFLEEKYEI